MACVVFWKVYHGLVTFHYMTPRAAGELESLSERTPNHGIFFKTLHEGKILVRYLIYPIDPFYMYAVPAQDGLCLALLETSKRRFLTIGLQY